MIRISISIRRAIDEIEYGAWGAWTVPAEYLYYDLNGASGSSNGIPSDAPQGLRYDWDAKIHVARFGLNYRFGAARY